MEEQCFTIFKSYIFLFSIKDIINKLKSSYFTPNNIIAASSYIISLMFILFQLSLDVLASVLGYSYLPSDTLKDVVGSLCRMVNIPKYCEPSWEASIHLNGCSYRDLWEK